MRHLTLILALLTPGLTSAAVVSEELNYTVAGQSYRGYLAYDDAASTPRPGVLVVHEWWGHNAYARQRANMLAGEGYVALALDLYGDGRNTDHPKQAQAFMQAAIQQPGAIAARFEAARTLLAAHPASDGSRLAALGYCFGGAVVLNAARAGSELLGVISFHGSLGSGVPIQPGVHHPRILVFNGEADPFVPPEQVAAFRQEMQAAKLDLRYIGYSQAKHSFTNPGADAIGKAHGLPLQYDRAADQDSWNQTLDFLSALFWH